MSESTKVSVQTPDLDPLACHTQDFLCKLRDLMGSPGIREDRDGTLSMRRLIVSPREFSSGTGVCLLHLQWSPEGMSLVISGTDDGMWAGFFREVPVEKFHEILAEVDNPYLFAGYDWEAFYFWVYERCGVSDSC